MQEHLYSFLCNITEVQEKSEFYLYFWFQALFLLTVNVLKLKNHYKLKVEPHIIEQKHEMGLFVPYHTSRVSLP